MGIDAPDDMGKDTKVRRVVEKSGGFIITTKKGIVAENCWPIIITEIDMELHIIACIFGYVPSNSIWNVEMETFLDNIMQSFCIVPVDCLAFLLGKEELKKLLFGSNRAATGGVINAKHLVVLGFRVLVF